MVRADYCGTGIPHTRNGTLIDMFDHIGIQKKEGIEGMVLEAVWGPEGAVCVHHTRWSDLTTLDQLVANCPRLIPDSIGEKCSEDVPGLLYNQSLGER